MRALLVAAWVVSMGCATSVASRGHASKAPQCQSAAPCPVRVAVTIVSEVHTTISSVALGSDLRGYVGLHSPSTGEHATPGGRGQILEIDGQGQHRMHHDVLPASIVRTDASGQPVVISRPWAIVLQHHGWLDGSYPRTLGAWPRHVLDVDVRGVEYLELLDARVGPGGEAFALLGHRQTTGQFPLLLARTDRERGSRVDTIEASHLQGLAALDVTPDGRPFAAWSMRTAIVAGILGETPLTVIGASERPLASVSALRVLAPTATEPALVSMLVGGKLLLARLGPGGPEIREVTEVTATTDEPFLPFSPGSSHEDYVTAYPEHHVLLRTERGVRLAWVGQHVDHARQCHAVTSEAGQQMECRTEHDRSRALLGVVAIGDDLRPTEPLTLVLASTGARSLAGDARGGAVALAVMRHAKADDPGEIDYVVLGAAD
jgi:hypothetical protein